MFVLVVCGGEMGGEKDKRSGGERGSIKKSPAGVNKSPYSGFPKRGKREKGFAISDPIHKERAATTATYMGT